MPACPGFVCRNSSPAPPGGQAPREPGGRTREILSRPRPGLAPAAHAPPSLDDRQRTLAAQRGRSPLLGMVATPRLELLQQGTDGGVPDRPQHQAGRPHRVLGAPARRPAGHRHGRHRLPAGPPDLPRRARGLFRHGHPERDAALCYRRRPDDHRPPLRVLLGAGLAVPVPRPAAAGRPGVVRGRHRFWPRPAQQVHHVHAATLRLPVAALLSQITPLVSAARALRGPRPRPPDL